MNTTKKVLVTGANGLLGTNTIIELLDQGYEVRGFLREKNSYIGGYHKGLNLVEGNILNRNDLDLALANCDYVIHTAAITDHKLLTYAEYERVNVLGTKVVMGAAVEAKVKKLVYVSIANVFGYGSLYNLGNESKPIMEPFSSSFYSISKKAAQDYVLSMKDKIEVVVVNPSFMIGAYDSKPSSGKIIRLGLRKKILPCPPGGKSFVCVSDVARGIAKALDTGVNGETYLLSNENLSFKEFFKVLNRHSGANPKVIFLPKALLLALGRFGSCARRIGITTQFSIENMKALCIFGYYSNEKAKTELGMSFNPIEKGISEAIFWMEENRKHEH